MYPSECGRALKYIICEGKNGCSIIPKKKMQKASSSYKDPTQIYGSIFGKLVNSVPTLSEAVTS